MTDIAVTRHVMNKPVAGTVKAGGAGAPAGAADALDGAFAAILDAAGTGKGAMPGLASLGGDATAAGKDGQSDAATLEAMLAASGAARPVTDIPIVKQADVPLPAETGEGAAPLANAPAKPRKNGPAVKAEADPTDPATLQAAAQLAAAAANAAGAAQAQPAEQAAAKKAVAGIDPDARGAGAKAATLSSAQKQDADADAGAEASAGKAQAASMTFAAALETRTAPAAAAVPAKADAPVPAANLAAQAGSAATQTGDGNQAGTDTGRDERPSKAALALAGAADKAANDKSTITAADPFQDILQSLPPVVQSQLGAPSASGLGSTDGAMMRTASTGELLNNQVIDMSVSGQWIDRMAREIAGLADGSGHSRFQLMPPNLGRIQVDLWQGGDKTDVRLLTETDEAARRLREGQGALEASARLASLSLGSVSVEKSSAAFESRDQGQNSRHQQQAETGQNAQQQASNGAGTQAQGGAGQGRNNTGPNRGGSAAVIGFERQAEPEQIARAQRADDPRVRFA